MSRKKTVKQTTKDTDPAPGPNLEPDSAILRYLRSIDDKLDRIGERLAKSEQLAKNEQLAKAARSSSKQKRRPVLWARTPEEAEKLKQENPDADAMWFLVAGTKEEAAKLEQENPDADMIIITNVPRAAHD